MRNVLLHIISFSFAMASLCAHAVEEPHDTLYFYVTWQHMLDMEPDTMIVDPMIDYYSPFEIYVETKDKRVNKRIKNEYIAATVGDSTWVINSNYLRKRFKGDSKKLHGYVPLFFNEKVAYAVGEECVYSELGDIAFNVVSTVNFYIDFQKRKVIRVDSKKLSGLLADYPDLRMRYESVYKNRRYRVVKDFFFDFIDRASEDVTRPYILDLVQ